jgi:hypothetical protein
MAGADFDFSQKVRKTQNDMGKPKLGRTLAEIAEIADFTINFQLSTNNFQ